jgi:L-malate glycosyltransferase
MEICFLGDGASIHIRRWCEFFRDSGDSVTLITFSKVEIPGVDIYYCGTDIKVSSDGGNFQYLKKLPYIKKLLKKVKPQIINAHYATSYGLLGVLCKNAPLIVSTWGSDILVTPNKNIIYKLITKFVLRKSNLVTSDSNFMSEKIIELGKPEDKVITSPMGINNKIFNRSGRATYNKNILSLRTLCKNSNIDIIIKAFSKLACEDEEIRLIVANDGVDKQEYINLINDLQLNSRVEFIGSVDRSKVVELLKTNTVYVSIPTSDSTSVTLLEAMSSGMIPIVSNLPANLEWISHNYNGYVIDEITIDNLYNCMKIALRNNSKFEDISIINNDIINERALWEDNMNFVRNSYIKLI